MALGISPTGGRPIVGEVGADVVGNPLAMPWTNDTTIAAPWTNDTTIAVPYEPGIEE